MKKVLLINATTYHITIPEEARKLKSDYFRAKHYIKQQKIANLNPKLNRNTRSYSLGLLRIATILQRNNCDVTYMDLSDFERTAAEVLRNDIDIIAFGAVTPTVPKCAALCHEIKKVNPSVTVAIGGAHVNIAKVLTQTKYPCFDLYIDGHDIIAAAKLLEVDAKTIAEPEVYADFSLLPYSLEKYILNTFTTLGCPYRCDYCQDHKIPYYENPDITGLLPFIGKVPRGSRIHYFDSSLGVFPNRTKEICKALAKLDHGFLLSCDARAELITPEIVMMMEQAGFVEIAFGMETVDPSVLQFNNRSLSTNRLHQALHLVRSYSNMYISIYNAVGIPGSTVETCQASRWLLMDWLQNDLIDEVKTCVYVPYPSDDKDYSKRGVIQEKGQWCLFDRQSPPVYHLSQMSAQDIWKESMLLLEASVSVWLKKSGFQSIDELPEEHWVEYLTEHNNLRR